MVNCQSCEEDCFCDWKTIAPAGSTCVSLTVVGGGSDARSLQLFRCLELVRISSIEDICDKHAKVLVKNTFA